MRRTEPTRLIRISETTDRELRRLNEILRKFAFDNGEDHNKITLKETTDIIFNTAMFNITPEELRLKGSKGKRLKFNGEIRF